MAKCYSSCNRQLEQAAAMLFPRVSLQSSRVRDTVTTDFGGRVAVQRCMCTRMIVVIFEMFQFSLQVDRIPE